MKINHKSRRSYIIKRYLKIDGKLRQIVPVFTEMEGVHITTTYALKELQIQRPKKLYKLKGGQAQRLFDLFVSRPDEHISSLEIDRAGSGKENGWLKSPSRRISDIREAGLNVVCSKKERIDGQLRTYYMNVVNPVLE